MGYDNLKQNVNDHTKQENNKSKQKMISNSNFYNDRDRTIKHLNCRTKTNK